MAVIGSRRVGEFGVTLIVKDVARAAAFYADVLEAEEIERHFAPSPVEPAGDDLCSVEMRLGPTYLLVVKENPRWREAPRPDWPRSPHSAGAPSSLFSLYVEDVDAVLARALAAGATPRNAEGHVPEDSYFGDRIAQFHDPEGHVWIVSTRVEDVAREDLPARLDAALEERRRLRAV